MKYIKDIDFESGIPTLIELKRNGVISNQVKHSSISIQGQHGFVKGVYTILGYDVYYAPKSYKPYLVAQIFI